MGRKSRVGFTLAEIVFSVALLSLFLGITLVNLAGGRSSAAKRSLAEVFTEELRQARQRAVTMGTPVGLAFPSAEGTTPLCQGFYRLEGMAAARMVEVVNFGGDFPQAAIAVGTFGSADAALLPTVVNGYPFEPQSWPNPISNQDPTLIFTPSGEVTSNGMARSDGRYQFLVGEELGLSPAGLSGPAGTQLSYFSFAGNPNIAHLIEVTPTGSITRRRWDPQPVTGSGMTTAALPPMEHNADNRLPVIESVDYHPVPNPDALPDGVDVAVGADQLLTLLVTATDPDGDDLSVQWTAENGAFSAHEETPMTWDANQQVWRAVWEWTAAEGAASGVYALRVTVRDRRGGRWLGSVAASRTVLVGGGSKVAFAEGGFGGSELAEVGLEGNRQEPLTRSRGVDETDPLFSPNQARLTFYARGSNRIFFMNRDGTRLRSVALSGGGGRPSWAPDSGQVVVREGSGLVTVSADGRRKTPLGVTGEKPQWCSKSDRIAFINGGQLFLHLLPTNTQVPVAGVTASVREARWSRTGDLLACATTGGIFVYQLDPETHAVLSQRRISSLGAQSLDFSFDDTKLAFNSGGDVHVVGADGSNPQNLTRSGSDESGGVRFMPSNGLAYVSNVSGRYEIHGMKPDGTGVFQMTMGFAGGTWSLR